MGRILFVFLIFSLSIQGQEFSAVANIVDSYESIKTPEDLAKKIEEDFTTDLLKTKAAFYWIATNFRYNLRELYNPKQRSIRFRYASEAERQQKLQQIKNGLIAKAFQTQLGVCEEYAQSLKKVCDLLKIEAHVVTGYVRMSTNDIGAIPNQTNHAWNVVKIDNKFLILDATWAAGYQYQRQWMKSFDPYYFNIPPETIFNTHFPKDRIWVLRFGRMDLETFYNQPKYSGTFLKSKATLISPKSGILNRASNNIIITLKNLPTNTQVSYGYSSMRYAEKPSITLEKDTTIISVPPPKRPSELVIYFNQRDALSYKVE